MIEKLIDKRNKTLLPTDTIDPMITEQIENADNSELIFLTSPSQFKKAIRKYSLLDDYNLIGIFGMSNCMHYSTINISLYILTKKESPYLFVSDYIGKHKNYRHKSTSESTPVTIDFNDYPEEYREYLTKVDLFIYTGKLPGNSRDYYFNRLPATDFNEKYLSPKFYSRKSQKALKEIIEKADVKLEDVAEIITRNSQQKKIPDDSIIITFRQFLKFKEDQFFDENLISSNLDNDRIRENAIKLQRNDIIMQKGTKVKFYLIHEEFKDHLYISSPDLVIIRAVNISPYYLTLYLNSNLFQDVFSATSSGSVINRISINDLKELPVEKPKENTKVYEKAFELMQEPKDKLYKDKEFIRDLDFTNLDIGLEKYLNDDIKYQLQNLLDQNLADIINSDIEELKICFNNKAYKATLIMAGSILEAFLLDWIQELEVINDQKYKDAKNYEEKLSDYIRYIDVIHKPAWMTERSKAHEIRKRRNLVHAKLCLKEDYEINEETCSMVIESLIDVINSRSKIKER